MIRGCGDRISLTPVFAAILLGTTACHRPSCDTAQLNERTKALVQRMHARNPVPGISVAIVAPGMFPGAVTAVHGVRSLASGDSLTSSDRFLAGSVGKMFFAGLALRDAGNGRLSLDAPVATFLPASGIAAFAWITPRMLLKHTGGIGEYDRPFMDALIREPARERQTNDWLDVIRRHAPVAADTGTFRYSDLNYVVLAMVLDAIEPLGAYAAIQQEILTPLQLYATAPSVSTKIERLVVGYDGERSMFGQDAMMSNGALIYNPQFEWGGGGFASTPTNLANFMTAFRRGRIFPDSLWIIAIAKPNGVAAEVHQWRGMGVHVDSTSLGSAYGHSGFMPGYVSWVRWYETLGVSVAMQVNASDEARLIDDGFDWVDSVAAITSLHCRAR